jgi:hypothetical protein
VVKVDVGLDASGGPAARAVRVGVVHAEIDIAGLDGGQPGAVGGVIVDIVDESTPSVFFPAFYGWSHTHE